MTGDVDTRRARARAWLADDPDPETRDELQGLLDVGDDVALAERFDEAVRFGTAGLRGPMGAGPNRMNRVVVRRATAGLMDYLPAGASVVVGHDSRRNSDVFATEVGRVVADWGGRAWMLPCHAPTPLVAFAVRYLGADAGVVCTASHNPPTDNGYKVYLGDGAQIIPPIDEQIAAAIAKAGDPAPGVAGHAMVQHLDRRVEDAYVAHVAALLGPPRAAREVQVVYSALHGVGASITQRAFAVAGFAPLHLVGAQCVPDGSFPTVEVPNPELDDTTRLARAELLRLGADVALVHDPDADRLGVIVPDDGRTRVLTGNEIGLLLADHVLRGGHGHDRLVVDTVVSSRALVALADAHRVHHERTLTGFKWIVRPAMEHPELRFVFGYEEALGFSVDPYVRDKDAISAGLVFADLVATLRATGRTVPDRLRELALAHGLYSTATWTVRAASGGVTEAMQNLRRALPTAVAGRSVVSVHDYGLGGDLPPTDLVELELDGRARVCIRPSGTEAKIKVYAEIMSKVSDENSYETRSRAAHRELDELRDAIVPLLQMSMTA